MIDWAALVSKFPELASVIAVILFALEMNKRNQENSRTIMATWREWLTEEGERNRQFMEKTTQQFREFVQALAEAQKHDNEMTRAAVHANGEKIAALQSAVNRIDERTRPIRKASGRE